MISTDLFGLSRDFAWNVRGRISGATGVPAEHVLLAASHSHTAPTAVATRRWGAIDDAYVEELASKLTRAARAAVDELEPVVVKYGVGSVSGFSYNRVRGADPRDIDPSVRTISFHGAEAPYRAVAVVVSFACHPVILGPTSAVSADFPGELRRFLKREYGDVPVLYFSGACGDIDPVTNMHTWGQGTYVDVAQMGGALGDAARTAIDATMPLPLGEAGGLVVRSHEVPVDFSVPAPEVLEARLVSLRAEVQAQTSETDRPFGNVNEAPDMPRFWLEHYLEVVDRLRDGTLAASEPLEIQVIGLGVDIRFVGIPAELYVASGKRIQRETTGVAIPVCYANGLVGYLPPRPEYERGSYTTELAAAVNRRLPFKEGTAEVVEAAISMALGQSARIGL